MSPDAIQHVGTAALAGLTALGLSFALTPIVRSVAVRFGWVAKPAADRWGRRVIARLGGVAMFLSFVAATLVSVRVSWDVLTLLIGATLVFGVGLVDDLRRMPPYTKLIAQLLIGSALVSSGLRITFIPWAWLSIPISVMWFVLVINAFNLLDNMDGLAAGIGLIAALFCAVHAGMASQWTVATLAAIVGGASAGFLRYNFPPAKIFMGDSGSHLLGLSLAILAMMGSWHHSTQLVSVLAVPTLVLAVPIFDTCFVTVQRLLHRQHPFVGGTDHVSHRLAVLGLSPRQTVVALYGVSVSLGLLSIASTTLKLLPAVALWLSVLTALMLFGLYLAQVKVYRLDRSPNTGPSRPSIPTTPIGTMLLHKRRLLEILVDFSIVSSAYVFAHLLRFEGILTVEYQQRIVQSLPLILLIKLACFAGCGLYQGVWRYLGLSDIMAIFKAVTLGSILSSLALLYLWRFEGYSRAVLVIDWMLTFLGVGGSRVLERFLDKWIRGAVPRGVPALIIGAGDTGARVLRLLKDERKSPYHVIGFLDDNVRKLGDQIYGSPVLGTRAKLPQLLDEAKLSAILIAISDPPGDLLQYVQECCLSRGVSWKVVTAGVTSAAQYDG